MKNIIKSIALFFISISMITGCNINSSINSEHNGSSTNEKQSASSEMTDEIKEKQITISECEKIMNNIVQKITSTSHNENKNLSPIRKSAEESFIDIRYKSVTEGYEDYDNYCWGLSNSQALLKELRYLDYDVDSWSGKRYYVNTRTHDYVDIVEPQSIKITSYDNDILDIRYNGGRHRDSVTGDVTESIGYNLIICDNEDLPFTINFGYYELEEETRYFVNASLLSNDYDFDTLTMFEKPSEFDSFENAIERFINKSLEMNIPAMPFQVLSQIYARNNFEDWKSEEADGTIVESLLPEYLIFHILSSAYFQRYLMQYANTSKGLEDRFIINGTEFDEVQELIDIYQIIIPEGITKINNLWNIDDPINHPCILSIPSTVTEIDSKIFEHTKVLVVYFNGTKESPQSGHIEEIFTGIDIYYSDEWSYDGYIYYPSKIDNKSAE